MAGFVGRVNFRHVPRSIVNGMIFEPGGQFFQWGINFKKIKLAFDGERDDFVKFLQMPGKTFERVLLPFRGQVCGLNIRFGHAADVHKLHNAQSHAAGGDKAVIDFKVAFAGADQQWPPVSGLPGAALHGLVASGYKRGPRLFDR